MLKQFRLIFYNESAYWLSDLSSHSTQLAALSWKNLISEGYSNLFSIATSHSVYIWLLTTFFGDNFWRLTESAIKMTVRWFSHCVVCFFSNVLEESDNLHGQCEGRCWSKHVNMLHFAKLRVNARNTIVWDSFQVLSYFSLNSGKVCCQ